MTMLARITAILERARVAGGWIDEDVAASVLAEMREPTEVMLAAADIASDDATENWQRMIDAAAE